MAAIVGIDIGTTTTRAIAYDPDGRVLAEEEKGYPLRSPRSGYAEQDPEEIFTAVLDCLSGVVEKVKGRSERVSGVSLGAAMHTLISLDEEGRPVTPSITYADNRASRQARRIKEETDSLALHRRTGVPIHPMSPLSKLLWFKEEDRDTFERTARWLSIKEYVLFRLFGEFVVDHSIASATGLFDLMKLDWDEEALRMAGISERKLSRLVPTTHILEGLKGECAERLGLDPGTPFVVGASDGTLANVGVGAVEPGVFACSIGTSGAVRTVVSEPGTDEEGRLFCYALTGDRWVVGGPINNGGIALRWLRDELFPDLKETARKDGRNPYDLMGELAGKVPAGSEGLVFLPYLTGERAPYWNPDARATFFGLTLGHGRDHLVRAVLEGVVYQMRAVAKVLEEVAGRPTEIRATGGFARSELWRRIMADVFDREVLFPQSVEGSCLGAAILGMRALGLVKDLDAAKYMVEITHQHRPDKANVRVYEGLTGVFDRLYERLEPEFEAIKDQRRREGA